MFPRKRRSQPRRRGRPRRPAGYSIFVMPKPMAMARGFTRKMLGRIDSDFDRVPNRQDCTPLNPFKQDEGMAAHTMQYPKGQGFKLPLRVVFYVPSTQNKTQKISQSEFRQRVEEVKQKMTAFFGGATALWGSGNFQLENGQYVPEDTAAVESYATLEDWYQHDADFYRYVKQKKAEWGQEDMAVSWDILNRNTPREGMHFW